MNARRSHGWRWVPVAGWLLLTVPCLAGEPVLARPEAVRDAADRVLRDDRLQTELPAEEASMPDRGTSSGAPPPDVSSAWDLARDRERVELDVVHGGVGELARALLWLAIIVVATMAAAWIWAVFFDPSRRSWARSPASAAQPVTAAAPGNVGLGDADALAGDGRFAEAIHVLLLRTIDDLRRRADRPVADSLTSREILAALEMPAAARAALSDLVSVVELTYFGGRRPARKHYARCRERYERFAAAYGGDAS